MGERLSVYQDARPLAEDGHPLHVCLITLFLHTLFTFHDTIIYTGGKNKLRLQTPLLLEQ